jgi:hypothetical protein
MFQSQGGKAQRIPPFGIPKPEMTAAVDQFFNALAADLNSGNH